MKISAMKIKAFLILTTVVVMAAFSWSNQVLAAPGAIFTSDAGCVGVNINIYDSKGDVYLNGGPNGGGPGLPEGDYYIRVTEPNGTVLGKSVTASAHVNADGKFAACYRLVDILFTASSSFTAAGYDNTTNNGGEYKAWASKDPNFANSQSKTDNFKVKVECVDCQPPPPPISISGYKFYDYNQNGVFDTGESTVPGWKMTLYDSTNTEVGMTQTDSDGYYEFIVAGGTGNYTVKEELRSADNWLAITNPPEITVDSATDHTGVNFGNIRRARLSGLKFRDLNMDGDQDNGEGIISGIKIEIKTTEPPTVAVPIPTEQTQTVSTDIDGEWESSLHPVGTTYKVCEIVNDPMYLQTYQQTAPGGDGCYVASPAFSIDDNGTLDDTSDDSLNFFDPVDIGNRNFGNIALFNIGGTKYYDSNVNGSFDMGEIGVSGVTVNVSFTRPNDTTGMASTNTVSGGAWAVNGLPEGTTFTACEVVPMGWINTAPTCLPEGTATQNITGLNFFNVKLITPNGGKSHGFWGNKNGQSILSMDNPGWRNYINGLQLAKGATNSDVYVLNPAASFNDAYNGKTGVQTPGFKPWNASVNATNMAYMLSVQFAASGLSVNEGALLQSNGFVQTPLTNGTTLSLGTLAPCINVIRGGSSGFITLGNLHTMAQTQLALGRYTVASGALRTNQECVKNALDKVVNNQLLVVAPAVPMAP